MPFKQAHADTGALADRSPRQARSDQRRGHGCISENVITGPRRSEGLGEIVAANTAA